jgi:hypothetical protein
MAGMMVVVVDILYIMYDDAHVVVHPYARSFE